MAIRQAPSVPKIDDFEAWSKWAQRITDGLINIGAFRFTPGQVTGIAISASAAGVAINWNDTIDAEAYNIYRSSSAPVFGTAAIIEKKFGTTNSVYFDAGAKQFAPGTTLYYWITAENLEKLEGPLPIAVSVVVV